MAASFESITASLEEKSQDCKILEIAASTALKQFQTLYNEIMCPVDNDQDSVYISDNENNEPIHIKSSKSSNTENRGFVCKQCVHKHKKICKFCDDRILCESCKNYVSIHNGEYITQNGLRSVKNNKINSHLNTLTNEKNTQNCIVRKNSNFKKIVSRPFAQTITDDQRKELNKMKLDKLRDDLNKSIEKELNVRIRSNPVPKHTHLPLYQNLVEKYNQKKKERKENLQEKVKTLVKPFQLSFSKPRLKRAKSVSEITYEESKFMFKAKPVPKNILSNTVSEKLKQKEVIRKILIAHRAEEKLKEASLPFSVKKVNRSLSMINLNIYEGRKSIEKPKSKRDNLTSINICNNKSKEVLEDWNKKVLQVMHPKHLTTEDKREDIGKANKREELNNYINKSKKVLTSQSFSFFKLPVRMSAAAMLREKQIRTDLYARKWREEQDKIEQELKIQKERESKKNLWPKIQRLDPTSNSNKIIEETIKRYRSSQICREEEYAKELQEIMNRVGKQLLLIERQTKDINDDIDGKTDSHFIEDSNSTNLSPKVDSDDAPSHNQDTANSTSSLSSSS